MSILISIKKNKVYGLAKNGGVLAKLKPLTQGTTLFHTDTKLNLNPFGTLTSTLRLPASCTHQPPASHHAGTATAVTAVISWMVRE